ncbi:MAG: hypothetical protein C0627_05135 [Sulfurimonas sp.]|nr:MAG: hypothetical protein C0627_05135 [Sulfurimonas sp.]
MTSSDTIASIAVLFSIGSFGYTIYSNNKNNENIKTREQLSYLKSLNRIVKSITYETDSNIKESTLDTLRDELNYCTCYDNKVEFEDFSANVDDFFFAMTSASSKNDYSDLKEKCLNEIQNFKP